MTLSVVYLNPLKLHLKLVIALSSNQHITLTTSDTLFITILLSHTITYNLVGNAYNSFCFVHVMIQGLI